MDVISFLCYQLRINPSLPLRSIPRPIPPSSSYCVPIHPSPLQTIATYLTNNVLPVLRDRHDEFLLHELVKRGENHMVSIHTCTPLSRFLHVFL